MTKKNLSRRQFLGDVAGVSAAVAGFPYIVSSSALGADGAVAPSERIVMGCIGVGSQGTGNMRGFLSKKDAQVVAICDIEIGASSVTVCHLGNIAYKLQRPLKWDPKREVFVGDEEANRLLSRTMRGPWHI